MKIKDLDPKTTLESTKVKTPDGKVGYWRSQWQKGVWLTDDPGSGRLFPQFVENLRDVLEWNIAGDEEPVNL